MEPPRDDAGASTASPRSATGVALPATLGATDFVDLVFLVGRGVEAGGSTVFLRGGMLLDAKEGQHRPRSREQKTYLDQALDGTDE